VDRQGRAARAKRSVLERVGDAEQRHDAIAGETAHRAALLTNGGGELVVDCTDENESPFLAQPFGDRGESHHVGEQDGDLAPFAQRR
jgi:hypothetical protein